jgi:peptidoglycan/xylan/chitin deacetylase (PgdA/CDA1 family)
MIAAAKKIIKYLLAVILYYSGLLNVFSRLRKVFFNRGDFAILMYHRVLDENEESRHYVQPGLYVSRNVFEKQILFLSKKYNLIGLRRLAELLIDKLPVPPDSLVVTFDDGWKDNYICAYPVLNKYGAPAIIFLTTDYIGTGKIFWFLQASILLANTDLSREQLRELIAKHERNTGQGKITQNAGPEGTGSVLSDRDWFIEKLKRIDADKIPAVLKELSARGTLTANVAKESGAMLTWEEVLEMSSNGIDFGSHGCSHRIMTALTVAEIEKELTQSKEIIERKLGREVSIFAYPNGDYNDHIRELVKKRGYICALTTGNRKDRESNADIYSLPRINVHDGISVGPRGNFSPAMFSLHIIRNR